MKYFVVVVVAALFSVASAASLEGRIVGGQTAEDGQFPYQVALVENGRFSCGGSILNENYVLTAAHCVTFSNPKEMSVVVGTNKISSGGEKYQVERITSHSEFSMKNLYNDISLIKVAKPIQFNDKVQPIQLETSFVSDGVNLILSGWGLTSYPGDVIPDDLQFIHLKSYRLIYCTLIYIFSGLTVDDTCICTLTKNGEGACKGDSGGPLVHDGKLAGIVSFGVPCANGVPDVYTRVSKYIDWINENMK